MNDANILSKIRDCNYLQWNNCELLTIVKGKLSKFEEEMSQKEMIVPMKKIFNWMKNSVNFCLMNISFQAKIQKLEVQLEIKEKRIEEIGKEFSVEENKMEIKRLEENLKKRNQKL